jgi:hypothetical protein
MSKRGDEWNCQQIRGADRADWDPVRSIFRSIRSQNPLIVFCIFYPSAEILIP